MYSAGVTATGHRQSAGGRLGLVVALMMRVGPGGGFRLCPRAPRPTQCPANVVIFGSRVAEESVVEHCAHDVLLKLCHDVGVGGGMEPAWLSGDLMPRWR
jgi:hypothetical protein